MKGERDAAASYFSVILFSYFSTSRALILLWFCHTLLRMSTLSHTHTFFFSTATLAPKLVLRRCSVHRISRLLF